MPSCVEHEPGFLVMLSKSHNCCRFSSSLDGKHAEGQVSEPPSSQDKPLAHPSNPISYAGTVKRPETTSEGTPPPSAGKSPGGAIRLLSTSPPSGPLSTSPSKLDSYAEIVRGQGGPQDIALDTVDVSTIIGVILAGRGNLCTIVLDNASHISFIFCDLYF